MLDHAVAILILTRLAPVFRFHVRAKMHACRVPPTEERRACFGLACNELLRESERFLVDGFHPLLGQLTGILHRLSAIAVGLAFEDAARAEFLEELRVLGIVDVL